ATAALLPRRLSLLHRLLPYYPVSFPTTPSPSPLHRLLHNYTVSFTTTPSPSLLHRLLPYYTVSFTTTPSPSLLHRLLPYYTVSFTLSLVTQVFPDSFSLWLSPLILSCVTNTMTLTLVLLPFGLYMVDS